MPIRSVLSKPAYRKQVVFDKQTAFLRSRSVPMPLYECPFSANFSRSDLPGARDLAQSGHSTIGGGLAKYRSCRSIVS
jgi:hypothetical protein